MLRRPTSAALLVLTALAVIAAAAGPAVALRPATPLRPSALTKTVVVHVSPVTASGTLKAGYRVTRRFHGGTCEAGSEATGDAYRCGAANFIIDPCWVGTSTSSVICLLAPYQHSVIKVSVKKHGFQNLGGLGSAGSTPWAVALANGDHGTLIQGAGGTVAGKRINYALTGTTSVLVGSVDKHGAVWRIHEATPTSGGTYKITGWAKLAKAWFGKRSRKG